MRRVWEELRTKSAIDVASVLPAARVAPSLLSVRGDEGGGGQVRIQSSAIRRGGNLTDSWGRGIGE